MDLSGLKDMVKGLTQGADQRSLTAALKLFSKGQVHKAIEALKEAHQAHPESNDILFDLARYLVVANRGSEAAESLRTILRRDPRAYARANEMIEELRARHSGVTPLYDAVAEHFIRKDDLKAALEALERLKPEDIRSFMARHKGKWEGLRKTAADAKLAKTSLHSAYYLALCHEVLRDYGPSGEIYRVVAKNNPEELPRVLSRLEGLLAKDYQNSVLRVAVADLFLLAGREAEAAQQFGLAVETDKRCAGPVAERIDAFLQERGDKPELRWVMVSALLAADVSDRAIEAMRPLVETGALLDQVISALEALAASGKAPAARLLLATALSRRGQAHVALEALMAIAEERGLPAIREPLEALAAQHPEFARAQFVLADVHLAEARSGEAVEAMRRARALAPNEDSVIIPKLLKILEADPTAADAHLLLADLLIKAGAGLGEPERAVVVLRHLVRESPASAGDAVARFAALLKENPNQARARIGAAEASLELKRFPEARQHLESVAAASPELSAEFLRLAVHLAEAAPEEAGPIAALLRALEPRSPLPHAVRFALGEVAFQGGDLSAAAAAFRDVLAAVPERTDEVRQALERFDRDDPRAAEARYLLASLYLDAKDHHAALNELSRGGAVNASLIDRVLEKYEALSAADPEDMAVRCGLVEALLIGRRYDRVLAVGQEILKKRDDDSTASVSLSMAEALRETNDPDGAVKRYFAAHARNPALAPTIIDRLRQMIDTAGGHALASLALGRILGANGRPAEAAEALRAAHANDAKLHETVITELQRLVAASPASPEPGMALLLVLRDGRDSERVVQVITGLLDAHPNLASILVGHLEEILKTDPAQPFATYEMGRALQALALHPKSAAAYLAAFRLDASLGPMILKRIQELIEAAPTCPDPYLAACAIHTARGRLKAAAEKIEQALEKMPAEAERLVPRLEEISRQNHAPAITLLLAQACLRAGQHEKAIRAFAEAAQKDPSCGEPALAGIEAILEAAPRLGEAYLARARFHALRLRADEAVADLHRAWQLAPGLGAAILEEASALRSRLPDSYACAMLLADLFIAAGKDADAGRLLQAELDKGWGKTERLPILIRLWRLASARQDDESARHYLEQASRLAPDRNLFLARVHEVHLSALRAQALRLRDRLERGSRRGGDLQLLLRALLDLGDADGAAAALDKYAGAMEGRELARLRAEIALRRADYPRATEHLRDLGPSRSLAFGAARSGDFALAVRTLEALATEAGDPDLRAALARAYRDLIVADLSGGRRRLQAETHLTFDEGAAA
jgi:tetratricopeptide (TPR) repeat protein